jgi:hypothetical protein
MVGRGAVHPNGLRSVLRRRCRRPSQFTEPYSRFDRVPWIAFRSERSVRTGWGGTAHRSPNPATHCPRRNPTSSHCHFLQEIDPVLARSLRMWRLSRDCLNLTDPPRSSTFCPGWRRGNIHTIEQITVLLYEKYDPNRFPSEARFAKRSQTAGSRVSRIIARRCFAKRSQTTASSMSESTSDGYL